MKRTLLVAFLSFALHSEARDYSQRVADAIKRQENSAHYPYGIKDGHRHTETEARRICLATIRNAWRDWLLAGRPGDYIDFLADQYCPPSDDPIGNANWKRNVHQFLK